MILLLENERYNGFIKLIIGTNHLLIFLCAPIVFLMFFYRKNIWGYLQLQHFDPRYLLLFPIALFSLYPLMGYIAGYIEKLELPLFLSQMDKSALDTLSGLLKMNSGADLLINLIVMTIIPAVGEELLFRGVIQKEIYLHTNRSHFAIWLAAFIFCILHFQVTGFAAKFMIGVILGYAYHFSGSLVLPIVIHMLNNGLATVAYYLAGDATMDTASASSENISFVGVLIGVLIFSLSMFYIRFISLKRNTIY